MITYLTPASTSISAEISPVKAPFSSKYMFSAPTATFVPFTASTTGTMSIAGTQYTTSTSSDLTIDAVSVALQDMYMENYGIGFTTSSYSTNAQYNEIEVSPWTSEIWECVKHLPQNSTWTTSNVEIVVAKKQSEYKVDEYNETSFYRAYEEAWPECFGELAERKLANKISSKATVIKQRNALRTTNMIVYKSRNIHDEILSVQQLADEKELQRIKNEARQQEIADSIEQDKMKQEYKNQSI